jgi:3-oxoacyl-[acyl-carrier-protein] synthase II
MERRVAITGLGTVNPLGNNVADFWTNVRAMKNGITRVTRFDPAEYTSQVAGEVKDFSSDDYIEKKEARRMDPFTVYAMVSALQAAEDAGIGNGDVESTRFGVVIGNGIGGLDMLTESVRKLYDRGPKAVYPLLAAAMIPNIAGGYIAIRFNAQGPCHTVVTACSSGTDGIGMAYRWIKSGMADVMIAGGTEAAMTPLGLAAFCAIKALATRYNDSPEKASRPFDAERDGFVLGEGAGILVLEELEHARARGAGIYAEVGGYGVSCDANHLTAPHPQGEGAAKAMRMAIEDGGIQASEIDYINAHGTSTPLNDLVETGAIKAVLGEHARQIKISSTKSMIGHLLGGSGGVEAVATVLAVSEQYLPGTRNLDNPDPACDLNYLPKKGEEGPIRAALSNSFGFGGHNAVLLFKRYEE